MTRHPKPKRALWFSMKTGIKPHGFSASTKQRKRIRKRSPAYEKRMRLYRGMVKEFLLRNPVCAVYGFLVATECHHVRGRVGSLLLDTRFYVPVSSVGHRYIHDHPTEARDLGLLCAKGQWNTPPK